MSTVQHEISHAFDVADAIKHGVDKAILLTNISYWCRHNAMNEINFHDGRYWTYNTAKAFEKQFPYMSYKKIERLLREMEQDGIILVGNYNKKNYDRTKWFAIPCPASYPKNEAGFKGNVQKPASNLRQPCLKNEAPIPDINIPDINITKTCASEETDSPDLVVEDPVVNKKQIEHGFEILWGKYHYRKHRKESLARFTKTVKNMTNEKMFELIDKILLSFASKSREDAIGWKNTLLSSYLNGECWNDEISGQFVKKTLDLRDIFTTNIRLFLNNHWSTMSDMDDQAIEAINSGMNSGWVTKQANIQKLIDFGFKIAR